MIVAAMDEGTDRLLLGIMVSAVHVELQFCSHTAIMPPISLLLWTADFFMTLPPGWLYIASTLIALFFIAPRLDAGRMHPGTSDGASSFWSEETLPWDQA